jgi:DNA-directed RNA polymerase subunit RPC12/RpoP
MANPKAAPSHTMRRPTLVGKTDALTELTDAEARYGDNALRETLKLLGGREGILDTLVVASNVPEVDSLLRLCADPRYDGLPLHKVCAMAGLTVVDLFAAYKKAMITKAHLTVYKVVTDKLQPVVEDLMKRAAPYEIPCSACGARGEVVDDSKESKGKLIVCPTCNGQKVLIQLPDLDRQKVVLELAQLVQKAQGINILQQNNNAPPPPVEEPAEGRGTLIEMQHALAELQRGPRTPLALTSSTPSPVDAEIIEATPTSPDPSEAS